MLIPKDIRTHLAMTEGYIQKNDIPSALECLALAVPLVRDFCDSRRCTKPKYMENCINTLLAKLCDQPLMSALLNPEGTQKTNQLRYQQGKEGALATVLREFANIIREQGLKSQEIIKTKQRLQELLQKGQEALNAQEYERSTAFFERLTHEFHADSSIILQTAQILMEHKQYLPAMKILSESLAHHHKNEEHYMKAMEAALAVPSQAQAEHIYGLAKQHLKADSPVLARLAQLSTLALQA